MSLTNASNVETKSKAKGVIIAILVGVILVPIFFAAMSMSDIDAEHQPIRKNQCYAITERYYSPSRGTSLELCQAEGSMWQGRICRLTALDGSVILSTDEAYECTILTAKRSYWDGVIIRDGYGPFRPDLEKALDSIPIGK